MSIRSKLVITIGSMIAFLVIVSNAVSGIFAETAGEKLITAEVADRLKSVRELKAAEIDDYLSRIENQVVTFAQSRTITDLMVKSKTHFHTFKDEVANQDHAAMEKSVKDFYVREFGSKYARTNPGASNDQGRLMSGLDANSIALQYHYISANPSPLGGKEAMDHPGDTSAYSAAHKEYHPIVRSYLEHFAYYDIFLVDPDTGHIVYSVFKELDYATSLKNGPYANSGIAEAFREGNKLSAGKYYITEFKSYTPSYEGAASFISTPIFVNGKKEGVLIFQMPIDAINEVMTNAADWEKVGLGKTGESYLVSSDLTMLNGARGHIENSSKFYEDLATNGVDPSTIAKIKAKESTIGILKVNTPGVQAAMQNQTGVNVFNTYHGSEVISAYGPLKLAGLHWAVVTEISNAEAHAPAATLTADIISSMVWVIASMLVIGCVAVWWYTGKLTVPIDKFSKEIEVIEKNADLSHNIDPHKDDVTRDIATSVNRMLDKFGNTVTGISEASHTLSESSAHVLNVTRSSHKVVHDQKEQTASVAESMHQMSDITRQVATNATDALEAAKVADQESDSGRRIVQQTASRLTQLADAMEQSSSVINKLEQDSESVGTVVEVINSIAEQTNLLALNAAIEAARAGEQGRGFAVVADEVRELARKTQNSTQQIQSIIEGLQNGAKDAVEAMEQGKHQAHESVESAAKATASLEQITNSIQKIVETNGEIASATESQSSVTDNINQAIETISQLSDSTADSAGDTTKSVQELSELASELNQMVKQFKLAKAS